MNIMLSLHAYNSNILWTIYCSCQRITYGRQASIWEALRYGRQASIWEALRVSFWSVGPRRPSDQSDAIVAGFLYMFVSILLCLVAGVRPRFHSSHLAPSEGSCLKRQPTLRWPHLMFALIQWPPGNLQSGFRHPLFLIAKRNACALHLWNPRKTNTSSSRCFCSFLKF